MTNYKVHWLMAMQTHVAKHIPLQGTVPLSWVTLSSTFQVYNVMKTHVLLGCAAGHSSPPAFPGGCLSGCAATSCWASPELWEHPNPIPAGKTCSWGTAGGNWVCLKEEGMPYTSGPSTSPRQP